MQEAKIFTGVNNQDLAKLVTCEKEFLWNEKETNIYNHDLKRKIDAHVIVIDYGVKVNILRVCIQDLVKYLFFLVPRLITILLV